jgi:hypothetical protein
MAHTKNVTSFLSIAGNSSSNIAQIYCALVAVELVLKQHVGLSDHNVPSGIDRVRLRMATGNKSGCAQQLTNLATKLRNDISHIAVQNKDLTARQAPPDCYPYLRYARLVEDSWGHPETTPEQLNALNNTVSQLRHYLKSKFGMPL